MIFCLATEKAQRKLEKSFLFFVFSCRYRFDRWICDYAIQVVGSVLLRFWAYSQSISLGNMIWDSGFTPFLFLLFTFVFLATKQSVTWSLYCLMFIYIYHIWGYGSVFYLINPTKTNRKLRFITIIIIILFHFLCFFRKISDYYWNCYLLKNLIIEIVHFVWLLWWMLRNVGSNLGTNIGITLVI